MKREEKIFGTVCQDKECEPSYGGKEDCEFNNGGRCDCK